MTLLAAVFLTTAELDDGDLVATTVCFHGGDNFAALDDRRADLRVSAFTHHQHAIDGDRITFGNSQFLNANHVVLGDTVLLATRFNHSVHGMLTQISAQRSGNIALFRAGVNADFTAQFCKNAQPVHDTAARLSAAPDSPAAKHQIMTPERILSPIHADMQAVDSLIRDRLSSDVVLINQLGEHIIASGGKRLRPALALLAARALNNRSAEAHLLAAVIEFIHTATLLHDDVVDHSDLRRGNPTANALWGNEASVLTGDFLYSRAFQMMIELRDMRVLNVLADTTNRIAEGEVLQLMNCHNPDITEAVYNDVIERKTAVLFEASGRCAAMISGASDTVIEALAAYGRHLGIAFQLVDDCLDYQADAATTGKNIGDDLAEGKTTLPVIIAMQRAEPGVREQLRQAIISGGHEHLDIVMKSIEASDAITYTARRAEASAQSAIDALEPLDASPFKDAMQNLATFSAKRAY